MNFNQGKIGLVNRGNTCYMNTAIQVLSNVKPFTEYIMNDEYLKDMNVENIQGKPQKIINQFVLTREFIKVIKALWTCSNAVEPKTFHQTVQIADPTFRGFFQQDSQEILSYILDFIHESLKYEVDISYDGIIENDVDTLMIESIQAWKNLLKTNYSFLVDIFFGQFVVYTGGVEGAKKDVIISKNFELFNVINLPIHDSSIYGCLDCFFGKELLDTPILDEKTGTKERAYRQIKMMKIPNYLIIVLKRYKKTSDFLAKENQKVRFVIEDLDLSEYTDGYDKYEAKMDLCCIGCHEGVLNGGHYYAVCKHVSGKWLKYNDSIVSEFDIASNIENLYQSGYILVYEKSEKS